MESLDFGAEEEKEMREACEKINKWAEEDPVGFYRFKLEVTRKRLARLMEKNAPKCIIENEKKLIQTHLSKIVQEMDKIAKTEYRWKDPDTSLSDRVL